MGVISSRFFQLMDRLVCPTFRPITERACDSHRSRLSGSRACSSRLFDASSGRCCRFAVASLEQLNTTSVTLTTESCLCTYVAIPSLCSRGAHALLLWDTRYQSSSLYYVHHGTRCTCLVTAGHAETRLLIPETCCTLMLIVQLELPQQLKHRYIAATPTL